MVQLFNNLLNSPFVLFDLRHLEIFSLLKAQLNVVFVVLYRLLKYTEYTMTVVCYTSQGDGPEAIPFTVRTQEDGN